MIRNGVIRYIRAEKVNTSEVKNESKISKGDKIPNHVVQNCSQNRQKRKIFEKHSVK
jgi:hypothetical protein